MRKKNVTVFLVVLFLGTLNLLWSQTPNAPNEEGLLSSTHEKKVINLLCTQTPNALIISNESIYEGNWKGNHGIEFTVKNQTNISKFKITFTFSGNCSGSIIINSSSISIKDRKFTISYSSSFLNTSGSLSGTFSDDGKHCSGNFSYSDPPCQTSGSWSAEPGGSGGAIESEPNNTPEQAQQLLGSSPIVVTGNAELSDSGDLIIKLQDEITDDIEDLFVVTTETVGLNVTLIGASSDLDLYLIDESASNIIETSLQSGVIDEEIDMPNISAGTYYIGVSIYDPAPLGSNSSPYTLTVTSNGDFVTSVEDHIAGLPKGFELKQNYPNPFNASTTIQFDLFKSSQITIKIYDILGREVKTLVNRKYQPGSHAVIWNGLDENGLKVISGRFLVRMQAGDFVTVKKMLMLK